MLLRDKRQPIKKPFLASLLRLEGMASKNVPMFLEKHRDVFIFSSGGFSESLPEG